MKMAQREFIGRRVTVAEHSDPSLCGLAGTVVDETRETLLLEFGGGRKRVAKRGVNFAPKTVPAFEPKVRTY